ncbi:MAG: hypothetical protein E7142_01400 [Rikenellaceae bacterium]|nr:hypothetical protein [Rikenellaceae bacterium]
MLTNLLQAAEPIMREPEPGMTLSQIFMAGGWHFMAILTLILVCALFAAWKAPAWVEALGRVAIAMGVYAFLSGVSDMANTCAQVGETFPFSVYCSGFKVALIAPLYSIIVYVIISLVDMVRRPRI